MSTIIPNGWLYESTSTCSTFTYISSCWSTSQEIKAKGNEQIEEGWDPDSN